MVFAAMPRQVFTCVPQRVRGVQPSYRSVFIQYADLFGDWTFYLSYRIFVDDGIYDCVVSPHTNSRKKRLAAAGGQLSLVTGAKQHTRGVFCDRNAVYVCRSDFGNPRRDAGLDFVDNTHTAFRHWTWFVDKTADRHETAQPWLK
ncbi:MAG: hypothetical protein LBL26_03370 [Peptococcaceae bacterium]|nr:hypothetical protein [Peptococcaceae bacterium]